MEGNPGEDVGEPTWNFDANAASFLPTESSLHFDASLPPPIPGFSGHSTFPSIPRSDSWDLGLTVQPPPPGGDLLPPSAPDEHTSDQVLLKHETVALPSSPVAQHSSVPRFQRVEGTMKQMLKERFENRIKSKGFGAATQSPPAVVPSVPAAAVVHPLAVADAPATIAPLNTSGSSRVHSTAQTLAAAGSELKACDFHSNKHERCPPNCVNRTVPKGPVRGRPRKPSGAPRGGGKTRQPSASGATDDMSADLSSDDATPLGYAAPQHSSASRSASEGPPPSKKSRPNLTVDIGRPPERLAAPLIKNVLERLGHAARGKDIAEFIALTHPQYRQAVADDRSFRLLINSFLFDPHSAKMFGRRITADPIARTEFYVPRASNGVPGTFDNNGTPTAAAADVPKDFDYLKPAAPSLGISAARLPFDSPSFLQPLPTPLLSPSTPLSPMSSFGPSAAGPSMPSMARVSVPPCQACGQSDRPAAMMMCDGCDAPYHTGCVKGASAGQPHPASPFYCDECAAHDQRTVIDVVSPRSLAPVKPEFGGVGGTGGATSVPRLARDDGSRSLRESSENATSSSEDESPESSPSSKAGPESLRSSRRGSRDELAGSRLSSRRSSLREQSDEVDEYSDEMSEAEDEEEEEEQEPSDDEFSPQPSSSRRRHVKPARLWEDYVRSDSATVRASLKDSKKDRQTSTPKPSPRPAARPGESGDQPKKPRGRPPGYRPGLGRIVTEEELARLKAEQARASAAASVKLPALFDPEKMRGLFTTSEQLFRKSGIAVLNKDALTTPTMLKQEGVVYDMAWSHSADLLALATRDAGVVVWRVGHGVNSWNKLRELHDPAVSSLQKDEWRTVIFSRDDTHVIAAGNVLDGSLGPDVPQANSKILPEIKVFNLATGEVVARLRGHKAGHQINCVRLASFDGRLYLVSAATDGIVKWQLDEKTYTCADPHPVGGTLTKRCYHLDFVPGLANKFFLVGTDAGPMLVDLERETSVQSFENPYSSYCDYVSFAFPPLNDTAQAPNECFVITRGVEVLVPDDRGTNVEQMSANKVVLHKLTYPLEGRGQATLTTLRVLPQESRAEFKANLALQKLAVGSRYVLAPTTSGVVFAFNYMNGEVAALLSDHAANAAVRAVLFHPTRPMFISAGTDDRLVVQTQATSGVPGEGNFVPIANPFASSSSSTFGASSGGASIRNRRRRSSSAADLSGGAPDAVANDADQPALGKRRRSVSKRMEEADLDDPAPPKRRRRKSRDESAEDEEQSAAAGPPLPLAEGDVLAWAMHGRGLPGACEKHRREHFKCPIDCPRRLEKAVKNPDTRYLPGACPKHQRDHGRCPPTCPGRRINYFVPPAQQQQQQLQLQQQLLQQHPDANAKGAGKSSSSAGKPSDAAKEKPSAASGVGPQYATGNETAAANERLAEGEAAGDAQRSPNEPREPNAGDEAPATQPAQDPSSRAAARPQTQTASSPSATTAPPSGSDAQDPLKQQAY